MKRKKHPTKEIEEAVSYAVSVGWRYIETGKSAHAWCRLYCPFGAREGCMISIWSTPRNPIAHALQIERAIKRCPHESKEVLK